MIIITITLKTIIITKDPSNNNYYFRAFSETSTNVKRKKRKK